MAAGASQDNRTMEQMETLERAIASNDLKLLQSIVMECADINEQNGDGNTALHLAISKSADFEILKVLLMNGSSVMVKNNDGYTPLQLIDPDSSDTILNMFRLEHYIDYTGGLGNTIMHLMMMIERTDTQIWNTILEEFPHLKIDFNAQNKLGQTPLHIAASKDFGTEDLQFLLSNFEHLNLLLEDKNGDTFLHTFLAHAMDDEYYTTFLNYLLEGEYKCCLGAALKQVLRSKNLTGHTPLHLCISEYNLINVDILKMFLKAGSEINSENIYGENLLHVLVRCFVDEAEVIEYAVTNGGNVNARNGFGETPIFLTDNKDIIEVLINAGANVNVKNKVGNTPLMTQMLKTDIDQEVIKVFLVKGADLNAIDVHGNNVLHLAAWNGVGSEVVNLLKQYGVRVVPDTTGQLPCYVAQYRGHVSLIEDLCICENKENAHLGGIVFQKQCIEGLFEQNSNLGNDTCIQELAKLFQPSCISDTLKIPGIGSVSNEEEAGKVKLAVVETIRNICEEMGKQDIMLTNSVIQSGSVSENTKVGLPDEFDFICLIDLFSSICEVDEAESMDDPGYVYLKLKQEFRKDDQYRHLFNEHCYLAGEALRKRFITTVKNVIQNPALISHANMTMEYDMFKESQLAPNCQFALRWRGCTFKDIQINIDLVPACRINGWWPPNAQLDGLACNADEIRKEGALLLCQTCFDEEYEQVTKLRISAQSAEKMHMTNLPQIARDAYMVSKILCDERVCPMVVFSKHSEVGFLKTKITSYMLKNCLFHVLNDACVKSLKGENPKLDNLAYSSERLHDYVCKIFRKFKQCIQEEKLSSYIFPWQDIFTFQDALKDTYQNHRSCTCRLVHTKLILTILGEVEDFSDIDVKVLDSP